MRKFVLGYSGIFFLSLFFFYTFFLSTSVFGGDSGDFLAAIAVHGVPHPSGYPLYTIIGILFSFLPFSGVLAWKVGLASALFSAATVMFVYLIVFRLWKNRVYAFITSLTLAFMFPFWLYAEITEVMSLQHFFIAAILYFLILYRETRQSKYLYLIALLYGLSLTNNQTMLLLFPVVFILVVKTMYKSKEFFRRLFFCTVFFVLGFLPYLYLPIAASFSPPVNWNNPVTLQNFLHLVLRQDYGWAPKAVIDNSVRLLFVKRYFIYFISELTFLGVILITLGVGFSFLRSKKFLITLAFLLGFFLFGPFFFYYGAGPSFDRFSDGAREKFYASSLIFLVLFLPFGLEAIMLFSRRIFEKIDASEKRIKLYQKGIILFFFLLPLILCVKNVKILNIRDSTRITEVFASQLLINLPKDSVFVAQHDNILFTLWYMQFVNNRRRDIFVVLPKELSRLAGKGMLHLGKPSVSRAENLDSYVDAVAFSLSASVFISETDYHSVVNNDGILLYPYGLVWKYATNKERHMREEEFIKKQGALLSQLSDPNKILSKEKKDRLWLLTNIPLFYAHAYTNTGYFLMYAYHDYPLARKYFEKAIAIDDQDHWGYEGLGISYYQQKDYKKAQKVFKQTVEIQPLNHNAYFLLYGTYLALNDKDEAKKLEEFFKQYNEIYSEFKFEKTRVKLPR